MISLTINQGTMLSLLERLDAASLPQPSAGASPSR